MITKVKTNTSNYRKLAIRVRAKEACKNHVFDACLCVELKIVNTKNGNKQIWVKDVMIELLFCTRILKSTTIPGDLNDRIDRPRLSVRQVHISIPGCESFVQIGCTLYKIPNLSNIPNILSTKTTLINISTPIMISFSSFSKELLFF